MRNIFERYTTLKIADCKRLGYMKPQAAVSGTIEWQNKGVTVMSVGFATDTRGVPVAKFSYNHYGQPVAYDIYLRWKKSNLNPEQGYYYFLCPVTGKLCRVLYFSNGRFVSRHAVPALYQRQTQSRERRNGNYRTLEYIQDFEDLAAQKNRRETYRGNITPYGRKLQKLKRIIEERTAFLDSEKTDV